MKKLTLILFCFLIAAMQLIQAQVVVITGKTTDQSGEPLPGVTVLVKGTTVGAISGADGTYRLTVPAGGTTLAFSFIGFEPQEAAIAGRTVVNAEMKELLSVLDEIVVVGYGTQAKKDITGAISVVTAEALTKSSSVSFAQALQGKSSGVFVSTTGAPGADSKIRIRGVGSVNGSDPLIIIDGVSGGSISSVNPNDIETFQVLKDASATAIYGAQGANGVIIVTTKQGTKSGQPKISYNAYVGQSSMANSGFNLLNGWEMMDFYGQGMINLQNVRGKKPDANSQFGALTNVAYDLTNQVGSYKDINGNIIPLYFINSGELTMPYATNPAGYSEDAIIARFGSVAAWEASYLPVAGSAWARSAYSQMLLDGYSEAEARKGTDWYDLVVRKGIVQDHQLSIVGGNDKGQYSMSLSYTGNEGTIKSSFYNRYGMRVNTTFTPRSFITIGQNTNVAFIEYEGDRGNQADGSVFGQIYTIKSWVPVYNVGLDYAGSRSNEGGRTNSAFATVNYQKGDWNRSINLQNSIFAEIKPVAGLTLKSQLAPTISGVWGRNFSEITAMGNKEGTTRNQYTENASWRFNWQWTNTATYTKKIGDNNVTVVVGSEALDQGYGRSMQGSRYDYNFPKDQNTWILNNGSNTDLGNTGSMPDHTSMFGYFGRADYSYKGKYLATAAVRRDASSKFGTENRWGTFPSLSLGWRISDEAFMAGTSNWLNDLKIRAGYGTTGNSNIGSYNWSFQYGTGDGYLYSTSASDAVVSTGYGISNLGDLTAKWETIKMTNLGFDATALDSRLTIGVDYYIKNTSDMLVPAPWSALAGNATKPNVNIGDMKNTGYDVTVGWSDEIGQFSYGINGNVSHYKNEVIKLGSSDLFTSTRITNITITTPGQPIGMFYGYNVLGIYSSADDVLDYTTDGVTIVPYGVKTLADLVANDFIGRFKFEDVNSDGVIDAKDTKIIGNPHPDLTGGLNLTAGYGNWDLSTYMYFSVGNDLYKMYEFYTLYGSLGSSYTKERRDNSWSPTNLTGIYPLWAGSAAEASETTATSNSLYVEDGSYLRMQNLSLGYSLPKVVMDKIGVTKLRVYGQLSNVFTLTKYSGLDPEVNSGSTDTAANRANIDRNMGIDFGAYGIPRQLIFGVNVTF